MSLTPKGYCAITDVENYVASDANISFEPAVSDMIAMAESYIEKKTGRVFIAGSTASAKKYDYKESREIEIDDCVEITSLTIFGEVVSSADYFKYPANELPYNKLVLADGYVAGYNSRSGYGTVYMDYEQAIEVSAKWGYSVAVPNDIRLATIKLVVAMVSYSGDVGKQINSETIGNYNVSYDKISELANQVGVDEILKPYIRQAKVGEQAVKSGMITI